MQIEFKKVGFNKKEITIKRNSLQLHGVLNRQDREIVNFNGELVGNLDLECSRCGTNFIKKIDEPIRLKFSDGIYKGFDEEADVIEFYEGTIDFDFIIDSEEESIKAGYNYCSQCEQQEEGENYGST
ncbi:MULTISPECIES: hypothetical protein [unclassified Nitratiruptor]|uniref:hypothetical protein n=1 Tax=unclassified Nitratiruptor TaxID=2624044 RepID=UPI001915EE82|nr:MULTISPECIES: hypothetical protein [unclassified Nitratiruptor]BCD59733.1 hypothetical protein NitYY0810_C0485 [Nitratiruptor sp. YY08-10]BCD63657.1 hypothetical protein NitYY0814_C0485 [Nitratiruptor sp. YY08-14]